jgi:hypothetical protein
MRKNIKQLCVTSWGAVLELKQLSNIFNCAWVADPDAVDAGYTIRRDEIILIARKKVVYKSYDNPPGCGLDAWGN